MNEHDFHGFTPDTFAFLRELRTNNNRDWFQSRKPRYESEVLAPAVALVSAVGERLRAEYQHVRYDTRTNGSGSLMRIYRDTRFSADKSPYKTQIAMMFTSGTGKKTESPGFGLQLSASGVELMAGMFRFAKDALSRYRTAVDEQSSGEQLVRACADLDTEGGYTLEGATYKRVPRGFDPNHPRADLLRHSGLYATAPPLPVDTALTGDLPEAVLARFRHMAPIEEWLVEHMV